MIRFYDANGRPTAVSGTLTLGGETLSFDGIETIEVRG